MAYGSAKLDGVLIKDRVCIDNRIEQDEEELCVNKFDFFAIMKQEGLSGSDGILGLAPNIPENGPSYVEAL